MKLLMTFFSIISIFTLAACKKDEVNYKVGDTLTVDNIKYELYDVRDMFKNEVIWTPENSDLNIHGAYYLDMLNYKNYSPIPNDIYEKEFNKTKNSIVPPYINASMYAYLDVTNDDPKANLVWVVTGYETPDVEEVYIPEEIAGYNVHAVGFRALEKCNMKSLVVKANKALFYPFAVNDCPNLEKIETYGGIFLPYAIAGFSYSTWLEDSEKNAEITTKIIDIDLISDKDPMPLYINTTHLFDNSFYNLRCKIRAYILPNNECTSGTSSMASPYNAGIYNMPFEKCKIYSFSNYNHTSYNSYVMEEDGIYYHCYNGISARDYVVLGRKADILTDSYLNNTSLIYRFIADEFYYPFIEGSTVIEPVYDKLLANPNLEYILLEDYGYEYSVVDNYLIIKKELSGENKEYKTIKIPEGVKVILNDTIIN